MTYLRKLIPLLLVIGIISGCNSELPENPYPKVITLAPTDMTGTQITFHGEITRIGNLPIKQYGFIWHDPDHGIIDTVSFGQTITGVQFEYTLKNSFNGEEFRSWYTFQSFAKTDAYIALGELTVFDRGF